MAKSQPLRDQRNDGVLIHCAIGGIIVSGSGLLPDNYFIPNSLPILFLRPCLVVGIPVALAIFLFIPVMPNARFQLKEKPGIMLFFLLLAIFMSSLMIRYN